MSNVACFRVYPPFLALNESNQKHPFHTVPEGSTIEILDEFRRPGLIHIRLDDQEFLAFARDIEERTERVKQLSVEIDRLHEWTIHATCGRISFNSPRTMKKLFMLRSLHSPASVQILRLRRWLPGKAH